MTTNFKLILSDKANIVLKNGKAKLVCQTKYEQIFKYRLTRESCIILSLFDGTRTLDKIIDDVARLFNSGRNGAAKIVDKAINSFHQYIAETKAVTRSLPTISEIIENVSTDALYAEAGNVLDFPDSIYYAATNKCCFKCRYCYRDSDISIEEDEYLSPVRWEQLFKEVQQHSRNSIVFDVGGGEPFLRKDLAELLHLAKQHGLTTKTSTKMELPEKTVRELKRINLDSLQVSLDSNDPQITGYLTGIKDSFLMAQKTIDRANHYGVPLKVNAVITKYNIDKIPYLIEYLEKKNIKKASLTKYIASCGRNDTDLYAAQDQYDRLDDFMYRYNKKSPFIDIDYQYSLGRATESIKKEELPGLRVKCGGGKEQLFIRHDGIVGFCDALLYDDNIILGDLKKQSISEVWKSDKVKKWITPNIGDFVGTECHSCKKFYTCFPYRCFKRSIIAYHTPFEKDPFCPKGEKMLCIM